MSAIKKTLLIAILILVSVGITFIEIKAIEKKKEENYGELIIANQDILLNTPISPEDLKAIKVLKNNMTPHVFTQKEALIGKMLQVGLKKDEMITQSMIQSNEKGLLSQKKMAKAKRQ